jgi:hypothetical protein
MRTPSSQKSSARSSSASHGSTPSIESSRPIRSSSASGARSLARVIERVSAGFSRSARWNAATCASARRSTVSRGGSTSL